MNILLTSVGRRTYMVEYFKDALKGIGKVHAANSIKTYSMSRAHKSVLTPLIYDDTYIDFLLSYCIGNNISAIISLFDIDLPILAKNKSKFEEYGIRIIVSPYKTTQICNDKWQTYQFLKKNNFTTPLSYCTLNDCIVGLEKGEMEFPLIIKPRWGMGSIGIFQADNKKELEVLFKKTRKCISDSYLQYESLLDEERSVIIQQKIFGQEIDLDAFNDLQGNFIVGVPIKILEMRAGESDKVQIVNDNKLQEIGKRLSNCLNLISGWNIDTIKFDEKYYILEINCRFNGLSPFSHLSGTDFPKALTYMLLQKSPPKELFEFEPEVIGIKDLTPIRLKI